MARDVTTVTTPFRLSNPGCAEGIKFSHETELEVGAIAALRPVEADPTEGADRSEDDTTEDRRRKLEAGPVARRDRLAEAEVFVLTSRDRR